MQVDKYTKIVLTIIAVNLSILTVKNLDIMPKAYANEPINNLELAPNMNYGLVPLNADGSINVKLIASDEIDVNIVDINTNDELDVNIVGVETSDELDVNIDEVGGGYLSSGGPIPVEID